MCPHPLLRVLAGAVTLRSTEQRVHLVQDLNFEFQIFKSRMCFPAHPILMIALEDAVTNLIAQGTGRLCYVF